MVNASAEIMPPNGPRPRAQDLESLVLSCNKDGMDNLRSGNMKMAVEQLKYAEGILIASQRQSSQNDHLLAVTFNNLGCLYKRSGRTHAALSYLRRALRIEVQQKADNLTIAGTHLNICSIMSKLGKHDKAVEHALCALELLSVHAANLGSQSSTDDYSVLAIAYHNVAVEREFLGQYDQAAKAYKQGHQVALRCLGREHALTKALLAACDAVITKKEQARMGSTQRKLGIAKIRNHLTLSGSDTEEEGPGGALIARPKSEPSEKETRGQVKLPALPDIHRTQTSLPAPDISSSPQAKREIIPPGQSTSPEVFVEMGAPMERSRRWAAEEEGRWQEFASSVLTSEMGTIARNTPDLFGSGYGTRDATPTPEPFQRPRPPPGPSPGAKTLSRPGSAADGMIVPRPGSSASTAPTEGPGGMPPQPPEPILEGEDSTAVANVAPTLKAGKQQFENLTTKEAVELDPPSAVEVLQMFEQVGGSGGRFSKTLGAAQGALPVWVGMTDQLETEDSAEAVRARRGRVEPEEIMEQIDLEREKNRSRSRNGLGAQNDYRPNRLLQGSTRTSLVVRRSTAFNNQTFHRDEILAKEQRWARQTADARIVSKAVQKVAAERIQRVYRQWRSYLLNNREWITTTRICATLIQGTWRAYHVRRQKLDAAANKIQPLVRGFLVRNVCKRHAAAIHIQKRIVGVLTRIRMKKAHRMAVEIQRCARGKIGRKRFTDFKVLLTRTAIIFQRFVRMMIAKKRSRAEMDRIRDEMIMKRAAVDLQRYFRGAKDRELCDRKRAERKVKRERDRAATKISSLGRQVAAKERVQRIRKYRLFTMNMAATFIRKIYLAFYTRRHYLALKNRFAENVEAILVMQRFFRGFLIRVRMWRQAIQAEEQLWAAVEVQRLYRGFLGRLRFEAKYEEVWRREVASALLQKWIRGWLARARVNRMKRTLARQEFARARRRFLAAQKIQSLMRGKLVRIVMTVYRLRVIEAATKIQCVLRGFFLRKKLWRQLLHVKAVLMQAHARGFLVRRRRLRLICCVLSIERKWRFWRSRHPTVRKRLMEHRDKRKMSALAIQKHYHDHAQAVTVSEIGVFGKDKRQGASSYQMGKQTLNLASSLKTDKDVTRSSLSEIYRRVSITLPLDE